MVATELKFVTLGFSILFLIMLVWYGRRLLFRNPEFKDSFGDEENDKDKDL